VASEGARGTNVAAHTAVVEPHPSSSGPSSSGPSRGAADKAEPRSVDRYKIEFTASADVVDRLERVQALMAHRKPGCGFEVVVERALELLEAKLLKERFGVGAKPRAVKPERRNNSNDDDNDNGKIATRHVPRAVRREVYQRDGLQCAFVDPETGRRCGEAAVELQHHRAYALGGEHSAANVSLFCKAHNAHAARKDFGQAHMEAAVERQRARRPFSRAGDPAAPPQPPVAPSTAQARPTTAAQLGLFGS
jgi:5-methylcytosine-specific restriction endonuclease McrA